MTLERCVVLPQRIADWVDDGMVTLYLRHVMRVSAVHVITLWDRDPLFHHINAVKVLVTLLMNHSLLPLFNQLLA